MSTLPDQSVMKKEELIMKFWQTDNEENRREESERSTVSIKVQCVIHSQLTHCEE